MAGVAGSTFVDELNRLANGGATYPPKASYMPAAAAANKWAATTGMPVLAALNKKAGTTGMGLAGVCNVLGGTTGATAIVALRARAS